MAQRIDVQYVRFYTQGSAAKRIAPAQSHYTEKLPKVKKHKVRRIYVDPVATFGIVVALCMSVMMAVGVSRLCETQRQTGAMEQYVALLQQENQELQDRYVAECDLEAVEKTALALGMIPREEAKQIWIQVELPQQQEMETTSIWQRVGTFLAGLFA